MLKSCCLSVVVAAILGAMATAVHADSIPSSPSEQIITIAAVSGTGRQMGRMTHVPSVLHQNDVAAYRAIIAAQEKKQWAEADRLLAGLSDRVLAGSMLAERYLSSGYKASAKELRDWLISYPDHGIAPQIYNLACEQGGAAFRDVKPVSPSTRRGVAAIHREEDAAWENFTLGARSGLSFGDQKKVIAFKAQFVRTVRASRFDEALGMINQPKIAPSLLGHADIDEMKTVLAASFFREGMVKEAYDLAAAAADRSGDVLPQAQWVAGLALWRNDRPSESARHFEAVANSPTASPWLVSAGAYWAARANIAARRFEKVNHWLYLAASNPRVFYGLLARRALGQNINYSWEARPFTDIDAETLANVPAARRGLALMQLGYADAAEDEFNRLVDEAAPAVNRSLLALAHAGNMSSLAVKLGDIMGERDGRLYDTALYPLPDWVPTNGWTVDRALVLAIARQESGFNPRAKSPSGAIGLMQLMPATARVVGARGSLTDPAANLEYGQRYVRRLLNDDFINGNLLFLIASYNSGPGNVSRWLSNIGHDGDALLFLESIPARETRTFVSKVMTNYWAYCNQLGQQSPSLDSIAAGDWPIYSDPVIADVSTR